jgi:hypothetical protein
VLLAMLGKGISDLNLHVLRRTALGLAGILCVFLGSVNPAAAADGLDKLERGPKVGETIPHQLKAADQRGQSVNFASVSGEKGLILLFTRSFDW